MIPFTNSLIFSNIISFVLKNSKSNKYLGLSEKANIFFKHPHPNSLIQNIIWQSPLLNFYNSDIEFIQRILQEESERFVENPEQNLDLNFYLYTNILPKIDIAGMANGLEIRPPFLDERIVNFGNRLKTNTSLRKTKLFLRKYLQSTELEFLTKKPKHGFSFPIKDWYEIQGKKYFKSKEINQIQFMNYLQQKEDLSFLGSKQNLNNYQLRTAWSIFVIFNTK